jgi:dipeptidyl aminopeptidase/acylaminoacyl peptidase
MDMGGGDLRDILTGIDAVEKIAPVDESRLAIFGHSYGGYMTQWAVTQTHRFKAAAASCGSSDWVSDYSLNGIQKWQAPYFNGITPYDRQDIFDRISPLRFVKQVKTPTLLYGGELDVESPIEWGTEFWRALKALGVPVSLVIYAGEGHKFSNPVNEADASARTIAWFDKYVGAGAR